MKVLIKHERSIPNPNKPYEKNGKVLTWDNVNLYCVELDRYGAGPILPNDRNNMIVKIKYEEFEKLTGFTYEEFGELFPSNFFGHEISVLGDQDPYGRFVPKIVKIEETAYMLYTPEAIKYFDDNLNRKNSSETGDLIPF